MTKQRVSSTSITGVAPVTIYPDSADALFLDVNKYRTVTNIRLNRYASSDALGSDPTEFTNPETMALMEAANVPHLEDISIEKNETYLDATGSTKARITFKINNPNNQKIIGVDALVSIPT